MVSVASKMYDFFQKRSAVDYPQEISELVSIVGDVSGKDVLEIGAGTCKFCAEIKNKFPTANVFAADISKSHLELGKKKARIKTIVAPTEELDKRLKKRFDLIIGTDTIHHHFNRIKALRNCFKLLKTNGCLILRETSRLLPGFGRYKVVDKSDFLLSKLQKLPYISPAYFSAEEFSELLKYIGFKKIKIKDLKRDGLVIIIAEKK